MDNAGLTPTLGGGGARGSQSLVLSTYSPTSIFLTAIEPKKQASVTWLPLLRKSHLILAVLSRRPIIQRFCEKQIRH
jgi:hypothetical protein